MQTCHHPPTKPVKHIKVPHFEFYFFFTRDISAILFDHAHLVLNNLKACWQFLYSLVLEIKEADLKSPHQNMAGIGLFCTCINKNLLIQGLSQYTEKPHVWIHDVNHHGLMYFSPNYLNIIIKWCSLYLLLCLDELKKKRQKHLITLLWNKHVIFQILPVSVKGKFACTTG